MAERSVIAEGGGSSERCNGEEYSGGKGDAWWWRAAAVRVVVVCSGRNSHGAVVGIWWVFSMLGVGSIELGGRFKTQFGFGGHCRPLFVLLYVLPKVYIL